MRILLVDDKIPDPNFGAGFPRAYQLLISLSELAHQMVFLPTAKKDISELNIDLLATYGVQVCSNLEDIEPNIDIAIISRPHNMHYRLPIILRRQPQAKIIYDTEALWYRRYDLQLEITGKLPTWAYRYDELGLARQVDLCFVVNETEKKILEENGVRKVVKLAHALNPHYSGSPFRKRSGVLVVGGVLEADSSNEDGLWWFMENCWEGVRSKLNIDLNVTGMVTSPRLQCHQFRNVNLLGHVPDLVPYYEQQHVFVAATRFATGIPWKVHEAMAHGIPCVISPLLATQLRLKENVEAAVAYSPQEFIDKTIALCQDRQLWNSMREAGYNLVRRDCDPAVFKSTLQATLDELLVSPK